MTYKKYIKRGDKIFGPYYCESYRDEDGRVRTRFVSGPKKRDIITISLRKPILNFNLDRRTFLILSIILGIFFLLLIGNINYSYKSKTTGKAIEAQEGISFSASSVDIDIAERLANNEIKSNIDLTKNVKTELKKPIFDNKIIEFDVPEGKITLEFDLLNYSEWYVKEQEQNIEAENFDINVNESAEKYKWGYKIKLNDLNFMAKINVRADNILIIDNQTLKIGNYYLSFADLSQQNFTLSINEPVIISEINLTANLTTNLTSNLTEINITEFNVSEINITELNFTTNISAPEQNLANITNITEISNVTGINLTQENETEIVTPQKISEEVNETAEQVEENVEQPTEQPQEQEELPTITSSIIKSFANFIVKGVRGITGFITNGIRGITGLIVGEKQIVSVYVQKDFTNSSYSVGDLINLDPYLIGIMAGGSAVDESGNVYQCGTINASGSYIMNQSITNNALTAPCINITAQNVDLDCNGSFITSNQNVTGVYSNQLNTTIKNCNITMGAGYEGYGIYLYGANNSYVFNNTLNGQHEGLRLLLVYNSIIERNTLNQNSNGLGLYLSGNNTLLNNTANSNGDYGIYLYYNSIGNNLINNVANFNQDVGVYLDTSSNNILRGMTSNSNGYYIYGKGIYIHQGSNNNIIIDSDFSNSNLYDVRVSRSINNTFVNVTYNISKESVVSGGIGGELIRKWYYRAYVNDTNGNAIGNANVLAYNSSGGLVTQLTTNASGWTQVGYLIDYININGARSYYSNYTIYALNSSYIGNIPLNVSLEQNKLNSIITVSEDTSALVISNVQSSPASFYSIISWSTNKLTNSSINYGTSINLGNFSSSSDLLINHSINLNPLSNGTLYYYNITSCDFAGNCITNGTYNFTTYSFIFQCSIFDIPNKIYILGANIVNNTLINTCMNITAQNITLDCTGYSIISDNNYTGVYSNQLNTTIRNCNITMGTGSGGYGIYLYGANNSYVFNNTLNDQYSGLYLKRSNNVRIENNTVNSNDDGGIYLDSSSNNIITNNVVNSNLHYRLRYGYYGYGINIYLGSNNLLTNNIVNSNYRGIVLRASLNNNLTNNIVNLNSYYDIYLEMTYSSRPFFGASNNTFLNCSYNSEYVCSDYCELIRKWYYRAHVVDNSSTDVDNASVDIYNGLSGTPYIQLTTNSTGWTNITHIIEYVNTGGTRSYYDNSVIAANYNETLWDDHVYNVTAQQNNLNDSFIVQIDVTPPVLSGTSYTATTSTATITWTTDDPSNSSVTYWASPATTIGNNIPTVSHSITITGLSSNTTYSYNYTSCDFAGNCNTSSTYSFTTPVAGVITGAGGGGTYCIPNWKCSLWSSCVGGTQTRICYDNNHCGSSSGKPTETQTCSVPKEPEKPTPKVETPLARGGAGATACISNWKCPEWGNCEIIYRFSDLVEGNTFLQGEQSRTCEDLGKCFYNKLETKKCDTKIPVTVRKIEKCFKNYIEVRDKNNILISRLEIVNETLKKLNIQMLIETEYCPYCYDSQKNYDEDEIDCVYKENGSCPVCGVEIPTLRGNYLLILIILITSIFLLLIVIIWYLVLFRKTKKIIGRSLAEIKSAGHEKVYKSAVKKLKTGLEAGKKQFKEGVEGGKDKIEEEFKVSEKRIKAGLEAGREKIEAGIKIGKKQIEIGKKVGREQIEKTGKAFEKLLKEESKLAKHEIINKKKILKRLLKKYWKINKKLLKIRKKIFKKHKKIIKKEKKRVSLRRREAFAKDVERYKEGIEKLKELKLRINKLEEIYGYGETGEIKSKLDKDIEKLREKI